MNGKIAESAERIRTLREIMEISEEEMATVTDHTVEEYRTMEAGKSDFSSPFFTNAQNALGSISSSC